MAEIGDLIKITGNNSYHSYKMGEKYIICEKINNGYVACNINDPKEKGNIINDNDFILIYEKDHIIKNISIIESEINDIN